MNKMRDKPVFIRLLKYIGAVIPGNFLKTFFYLNFISKPRKLLRLSLNSFYRMEHIYDVLNEVKKNYKGQFSILEFGVSDGYSFTKKLYATKYLKMNNRITVHGFDSFEGMPEPSDLTDKDIISNDGWVAGQFKGQYESLNNYCSRYYNNYVLHKGYFNETIDEPFLKTLLVNLPILIWIDCDYYSSAKTVLERLLPYIPNGCVIYFDEYEFNYGSRYTGEARIIYEINTGKFGDGIELILDPLLSLNSQRIYRFVNINNTEGYKRLFPTNTINEVRRRSNDSPFP
jgi:hypothetical protein